MSNLPNETLLGIFARVEFNNDDTHTNIMLVNRHFYDLIRANKTGLQAQVAVLQFSEATMIDFVLHNTAIISYSHLQKFELQTSNVRTLTACVNIDGNDPNGPRSIAARRLVAVALHTLAALHELRVDGDSEAINTLLLLSGTEFSRRCSRWLRLGFILLWRGIVYTRIGLGLALMPFGDSAAPVALEDLAVKHGLAKLFELVVGTQLDSGRLSDAPLLLSRARDRVQASLTLFMGVHFYMWTQNSGALAPPDLMMRPYLPTHYPTLGGLRTADILLGSSQEGTWFDNLINICTEAPGSDLQIASAAGSTGAGLGEEQRSLVMRRKVQMAMRRDWHAEVERAVTQDETLIWTDFASTSNSMDRLIVMSFPLRRFEMLKGVLEPQIRELDMECAPYGTYMKIHDKFDGTYANRMYVNPEESEMLEEKNIESLNNAFHD